jgi:methionyl-tRNA formyltransferase
MKITILNTSGDHPINSWLEVWVKKHQVIHEIQLLRSKKELVEGDILFLISCSEIISEHDRAKFKKTLVIHASDLPKGRGWSPHIWALINGAQQITISLLEAVDKVDSGDIWKKIKINIPKTAIYNEINQLIFKAELELMDFAVENFAQIIPTKQPAIEQGYWPKRTPQDSEIDIYKSIDEQFDLIRVCDQERFPAFFYKNGKKFKLKIEKIDE